jgi:hypothetical protein
MIIEDRKYPGPRRRRLTPEDLPTVERVTKTQQEYAAARMLRDAALRDAFARGIHYLDVQKAAGVARRTARIWANKYGEEFGGPNPDPNQQALFE